tara:strand:- start:248 stop:466 length:219 start_codon:yes stop_codon:yes gene_type:complete
MMNKKQQKRLALILEARAYAKKMQKGSAFITDFKAMHLINNLIATIQDMLAENLELHEQIKSASALKKIKKE